MKCWMRSIRIELISVKNGQKMVFGDDPNKKEQSRKYKYGVPQPTINDALTIKVSGSKYAATNKDKGTVSIFNLTYETITKIIIGEYYKINIYCGYKSIGDPMCIFSGSVAYISPKIYSNHDKECYIIFASDLVARYSQNRMRFTLNSSVNLFAAINYMMLSQGANGYHIDENLKQAFVNEIKDYYNSASTILNSATLSNSGSYDISTDGTDGNVIDVTTTKGKRIIEINMGDIPMASGNPTVSSEGLNISLFPVRNFKPGDILHVDNALIDVSISNAESVINTFNTNYMDTNGYYMIIELNYNLENRGDNFQYNIKARALDIIKKIRG